MDKKLVAILALAALLALAGRASADWDPIPPENPTNHKMHFPQMPDYDTGLDVNATAPKILADDFLCTQTGPITDIHIWGSWLDDQFPLVPDPIGGTLVPDPGAIDFRLSLHGNIPDDPDNPDDFSRPDDEIWSGIFPAGTFAHRITATDATEGFFDPNVPVGEPQIIGTDSLVVQYNFFMDPLAPDTPRQEEDKIYWLDVSAVPHDPNTLFGWKSSLDHWEDDAVYGHFGSDGAPLGDWLPLKYPIGHDFEGQTLDLAFVITPEPATLGLLVVGGAATLVRRRRR